MYIWRKIKSQSGLEKPDISKHKEQLKDQKRQYFSHNVSVCFFVYFLRYVWWKRTQSCPIWHM